MARIQNGKYGRRTLESKEMKSISLWMNLSFQVGDSIDKLNELI